MANETKITEVVAESAAKQVVELNSKLQELKEYIQIPQKV